MNSPSITNYTPGLGGNLPSTTTTNPSQRRGAIMMGLASYMISFMHAGTKILDQDNIPISQMILIRCITLSTLIFIITRFYKIPYGMLGPKGMRHLLIGRAILGYLGLIAFMASVTHLRLGDAVTLSFTIPILMVIVSVTFLGESLSIYDVISVILGIGGVICVAQPEVIFGNLNLQVVSTTMETRGYFYAALSTITNTFGNILIRTIGDRVHCLHIVSYVMLIPILPSLLWCYLIDYDDLHWPTTPYYGSWLIIMILGAFLGQLLFSRSLQISTVNVVTPFIFLQVVFAFLNDWLLFNLLPPILSLMGAILISLSISISIQV